MSYKAMKEFQLIRPQIPQFMPQQFCSCVPGEKSLAKCINHKGFLLYLSDTGTAFGRRKERDIKQKVIYEKKWFSFHCLVKSEGSVTGKAGI